MKITDTIVRLLFGRQLDAARREGRADAERVQAGWNQTVVNARQQESSRQVYLEKESNALREMAKDLTREVLRYKNNVKTNDGSYPSDQLLGMDGYQTTLDHVAAVQAMRKRSGQPRKGSIREQIEAKQSLVGPSLLQDAITVTDTSDAAVLRGSAIMRKMKEPPTRGH